MARRFSIPVTFILEKDEDSGWYSSQIKEFPQAISQGKTKKEAIDNVIDALTEFFTLQKEKGTKTVKETRTRIIEKSNILVHG